MEEFSEEYIAKILEFYKNIGLKTSDFLKVNNVLDIYRILGIVPEFDENGNRKLTPYEILGVPPIIKNGKEVPIIFAIKNKTKRTKKIGKPEGTIISFIYKNKKIKDKDSLLEQLKKQYIEALVAGDEELADQFLQMIDEYTGGRSVDILVSFYDYTKFYRRMKKQLLIDLFNHFFLMYMMQTNLNIKEGIIKKGRLYKAFHGEGKGQKMEEVDFQMGQKILGGKGSPRLSKIRVARGDEDIPRERSEQEHLQMSAPEPSPEPKVPVPERPPMPRRQERKGLFGYLNKKRNTNRFRKYNPFEIVSDLVEQAVIEPINMVGELVDQVLTPPNEKKDKEEHYVQMFSKGIKDSDRRVLDGSQKPSKRNKEAEELQKGMDFQS